MHSCEGGLTGGGAEGAGVVLSDAPLAKARGAAEASVSTTPQLKEGSGRIMVPRWVQLGALPALVLILWLFAGKIGEAIFVFVVAAFIALLLDPLVRGLERVRVPRRVGVFVVYAAFVGLVVAAAMLAVPPLTRQFTNLVDSVPEMLSGSSLHRLQTLADRLHLGINVRQSIIDFAKSLAAQIPNASKFIVSLGISAARFITLGVIIVVVSLYMLFDAKRIGAAVARYFPTHSASDGHEFNGQVQGAIANYVKAQLLLSLALGFTVGLAMYLLSVVGVFHSGAKYALLFGAWTALVEVIPYLGPVLAAVPPIFVALFQSPLTALWVLIAFVVVQEIEGHVLVPVLMGNRFKVHPLIVIFAILAGNQIHGVVGMLLAIPLIPFLKAVVGFFGPRLHWEGWNDDGGTLLPSLTGHRPPAAGGRR
jgi:predicted PurR-regulated permease PerM